MSKLHATLKDPKPFLCFIVKEKEPVQNIEEFKKVIGTESVLMMDKDRHFYKYIGAKSFGITTLLSPSIITGPAKALAQLSKEAKVQWHLGGDGQVAGGYVILNSNGDEVDRYLQKGISDEPNQEKMRSILENLVVSQKDQPNNNNDAKKC